MVFSMPGMLMSIPVWFSFAILLIALESLKPSKGFLVGYFFGYCYYSAAFWWLLPAFIREIPKTFNTFSPLMGFLVYLVAGLFVGLYFGVFGFVFSWFSKKFKNHPVLLVVSTLSLLLFTEFLRSLPPLKFIGFRFTDALFDMTGILQLASLGGTELLLICIGMVNILIYLLWKKWRFSRKLLIFSALIICSVYTIDHVINSCLPSPYNEMEQSVKLAGVQTMITPLDKYYASEKELIKDFNDLIEQVKRNVPDSDLFILPETYFLYDINRYPNTVQMLEKVSAESSLTIVAPHVYEEEQNYYNAVQLIEPEKGLSNDFYGKIELNPFTEYLPFENLFKAFSFLKFRNYLKPGQQYTTFDVEGMHAAFPICFESFFPNVFINFRKNDTDFFCVITNDGYFTHRTALIQHFKQLQIRAVETNSWICHISNNGITGLVDPYGRVIQQSQPFIRTITYMKIPFEKRSMTLYSLIYDYINLLIIIFFFMCLIISFMIK
ncbi:MAG TPA: apolipoprotein N-acyltransferase [Thermotogota bacterium]|nr:apolipoprotein N-acyltransferase [Thermotogota bacterium]HRW33823.1 apolipoprotein N-acyltransferase [Thermotogota bacterium]